MVCGLLLAHGAASAVAADSSLAVLYPDVREPYRSVFQEIIGGIQGQTDRDVRQYVLSKEADAKALRSWLKDVNAGSVVALGSRGINAAQLLKGYLPVISGALMLTPNSLDNTVSGISLAADPAVLFNRLALLAPYVRRIHVIYNPEHNSWLVELAKAAATDHEYELVIHAAEDLKQSARMYQEIFETIDPHVAAIWIPVDSNTVDEKVILPLILKESWDRGILVFSSNPAHAKKGALFSIYPDNDALGRSLARMAERSIIEGHDFVPGIEPLSDVRLALNRRTADHLGINISKELQAQFDLIFPTP